MGDFLQIQGRCGKKIGNRTRISKLTVFKLLCITFNKMSSIPLRSSDEGTSSIRSSISDIHVLTPSTTLLQRSDELTRLRHSNSLESPLGSIERWARSRGSSKSSLRSWRRIWAVFQEGNGIHYRFLPWSGRCAPVVFACHSTEGSQTARNTLTLGLTLYIAGKQKEISWKLKQRRRSGRLS